MAPIRPLTMTVSVKDALGSNFAPRAANLLTQSERLRAEPAEKGGCLVLKAAWESDFEGAISELRHHLDGELVLSDVSVEYITDDQLLEPIMSIELSAPTDYLGDVIGELSRRRATIHSLDEEGQAQRVGAWAPLAPLLGFGSYLVELTPRDWQLSVTFHSYEPIPPGEDPDPDEPAAQALRA